MPRIVRMLYIEHNEICKGDELIKFLPVTLTEGRSRGIEAGMYPFFFREGEKLRQKVDLNEGLTAACGYSAAFVEGEIPCHFCERFLGGKREGRVFYIPRIGVMTVEAAHGTALEKYDESNSRAVDRAKGFYGMKPTPCHIKAPNGRFLR